MAETIARQIALRLGISIEHAWFALGVGIALATALLVRRLLTGGEIRIGLSVAGPAHAGPSVLSTHTISTTSFTEGKINVHGKTLPIDGAALNEVNGLIRSGRKLDAIKRLREATSLGLAEAKAIVDSLESIGR
jgi:hypothetical protein